MPRPRATNPLNLPPRVAYKHGAAPEIDDWDY